MHVLASRVSRVALTGRDPVRTMVPPVSADEAVGIAAVMFGAGGVLDCDALDISSRPGLGIEVSAETPIFRALI